MAYITPQMKQDPKAMKMAVESDCAGLKIRLKNFGNTCEAYLLAKLGGKLMTAKAKWPDVLKAHADLLGAMMQVESTINQFYGTELPEDAPAKYYTDDNPPIL